MGGWGAGYAFSLCCTLMRRRLVSLAPVVALPPTCTIARRWVACLIGALLVFAEATPIALAQPAAKVYRVGWIGNGNFAAGNDPSVADFRQGMLDLGFVEGRNFALDYKAANSNVGRLPELANELARANVDVIVTSGEPAAFAAKSATRTIPIVAMEFGLDPAQAGLVTSLGRPEGNVTGVASGSDALWPRRLALLREIAPKVTRVVVLWNPANSGNAICLKEVEAGSKALDLQVRAAGVSDRRSLERSLSELGADSLQALAICWDSVTLEGADVIAAFATRRKLPTVAPLREYVQAGALVSYGVNLGAHRRRAAYYVNRILKGAKPADLPVELPNSNELVVNVPTKKSSRTHGADVLGAAAGRRGQVGGVRCDERPVRSPLPRWLRSPHCLRLPREPWACPPVPRQPWARCSMPAVSCCPQTNSVHNSSSARCAATPLSVMASRSCTRRTASSGGRMSGCRVLPWVPAARSTANGKSTTRVASARASASRARAWRT